MANTGGKQFYSALQEKAMAAVKDILRSELHPIQVPSQGDFMWNWQNGDQFFNESTFDYISANVSPGEVDGTAQLSPAGGFPNAYVQVLNNVIYSLSRADADKLATAQSHASTQAQSIISDYQTTFGTITSDDLRTAAVPTKQDYVISHVLGSQWSGRGAEKPLSYREMANARNLKALLPKMPAAGDQVVTDVTIYLNLMQPVNGFSDLLQNGSWMIRALKRNAQYPDKANGGMNTVNPVTGAIAPGVQVGYGINLAQASIEDDLANTIRTITLGMTTSQASGDSVNVHVEGQAGFSVGSWLRFSTQAGASHDMSRAKGTSTECSVSITYAGYSLVPMAPKAWQQATDVGFYYGDPIAQAVKNEGRDVSGFKFLTPPPYDLGPFAKGGNFGMLSNLLIANYPTISITYKNANFSEFKQAWSENVSGDLTLFGFLKLGSFSQGAYGSSYEKGSDNSTFTVNFSASPQVMSVPQLQRTAYVIGGAIVNPGVTP
jgi:hypothetical protein